MNRRGSTLFLVLAFSAALQAQLAAYKTKLFLNEPVYEGSSVSVTGGGAPAGEGIWVELWRLPQGRRPARSVASTSTNGQGSFTFEGVALEAGDQLFVTLSRSWNFEREGDLEGWDAEVSDCELEVKDGVLRVRIVDNAGAGGPDGKLDPFFRAVFLYDPRYYRVIEVRLRNPVPPHPSDPSTPFHYLGIFWGAPWEEVNYLHEAPVKAEMEDFQTYLIPMGKNERNVFPGNQPGEPALQDDLWITEGALNNTLRFDPINNWPPEDLSLEGQVFEIDTIRIRENLRWEFNNGDLEAIDVMNSLSGVTVQEGLLRYEVSGESPDPYFFRTLDTGRIDTQYFTRFCIGIEQSEVAHQWPEGEFAIFFDDADSKAYWDDGGPAGTTTIQRAAAKVPYRTRADAVFRIDEMTDPPGEWSEDNEVKIAGLRIDFPEVATAGDRIAVDYYGFIPEEPYGPSALVVVQQAPPPEATFRRGDVNADGRLNVSDAIRTLEHLFSEKQVPCLDAADSNDDGVLNIADAIYLLGYLFSGSAPPPEPLSKCNADPTEDGLSCEVFEPCSQ